MQVRAEVGGEMKSKLVLQIRTCSPYSVGAKPAQFAFSLIRTSRNRGRRRTEHKNGARILMAAAEILNVMHYAPRSMTHCRTCDSLLTGWLCSASKPGFLCSGLA